jgi:hypothetical protein
LNAASGNEVSNERNDNIDVYTEENQTIFLHALLSVINSLSGRGAQYFCFQHTRPKQESIPVNIKVTLVSDGEQDYIGSLLRITDLLRITLHLELYLSVTPNQI